MNTQPVIVNRIFPVNPELLWCALTEKERLKEWFVGLDEFRAEVGFRFSFSGGPSEDRQYLHLCAITQAIPNQLLAFSWEYDGYPGCTFVSFNLTRNGSGTLLTLSHTGLDTFPAENPDFAHENFSEGWNDIINISLNEYIKNLANTSGI